MMLLQFTESVGYMSSAASQPHLVSRYCPHFADDEIEARDKVICLLVGIQADMVVRGVVEDPCLFLLTPALQIQFPNSVTLHVCGFSWNLRW